MSPVRVRAPPPRALSARGAGGHAPWWLPLARFSSRISSLGNDAGATAVYVATVPNTRTAQCTFSSYDDANDVLQSVVGNAHTESNPEAELPGARGTEATLAPGDGTGTIGARHPFRPQGAGREALDRSRM